MMGKQGLAILLGVLGLVAAAVAVPNLAVSQAEDPPHVAEAHAAIDVLATDLAQLESELELAESTVAARDAQILALQTEITELEARITELEAQLPSPTPTPVTCQGVQADTAAAIANAPAGATICVDSEIRVTAPIILKQGQTLTGGGSLNGSRLVSGFTASGSLWVSNGNTEGPSILCMAGLDPCGGNEMIDESARYADDVFYDDAFMDRFMSVTALQAASEPGFFFDYTNDRIYINRTPTGHLVELAVASGIVESSGDGGTIRDITLEKSKGIAAYLPGANDWTLVDSTFRLNHGSGFRIGGGTVVDGVVTEWNGMSGWSGTGTPLLVENSEIAFNNAAEYRRAPGNGCWSAGAFKVTHSNDFTFRFNNSHDNFCDGGWNDNDVIAVVHDNSFVNNVRLGYFWELMTGDDELHFFNNLVQGNGADGFRASDADGFLVENNTFGGNVEDGFAVGDSARTGTPGGIFRNNIMNGDSTPGCSFPGVTCSGNS